jgi:DNA-binding transcriptional ArsR family regulator
MKLTEAVGALGALAQETRLAIFRLLVQAGPEGLPAGIIAERLGVAPPTLSFHLSQLSNAGLVTSVRQSRSIVYAPDFDAMRGLVGFLTENCCGGDPSRCAPPVFPSSSKGVRSDEADARARRGSRS